MHKSRDKQDPTKYIERILSAYNESTANHELEMRFVATAEMADNLLAHYKKTGDVIQHTMSLNIIEKQNYTSLIITRHFDVKTLNQTNITYHSKKAIMRPYDDPQFRMRLALSEESTIPEFVILRPSFMRFKNRYSIIFDTKQIDITYVRETQSGDIKILKQIKAEIFGQTPEKFCDRIEVEVEFKRTNTQLTVADIMAETVGIMDNMDPNYSDSRKMTEEIEFIAGKMGLSFNPRMGLKQISNQVIGLDRNSIKDINIADYYITDKADGERAFCYVMGKQMTIISHKVEKKPLTKTYDFTLVDAELVSNRRKSHKGSKSDISNSSDIYVFDVLFVDDVAVYKQPFEERLPIMRDVAKIFGFAKDMLPIERGVISRLGKKYDTDGYILTPKKSSYDTMVVYKLKPPEQLTIDFLVMYRENQPLLFVGINPNKMFKYRMKKIDDYEQIFADMELYDNYFPIQFSPSSNPHAYTLPIVGLPANSSGKICECLYEKGKWRFIKYRDDRIVDLSRGLYFGNDFDTAESNFENALNPLHVEDLFTTSTSYFRINDNPLYKNVRSYNSMVKSLLIKSGETAVDLGSGKGQDLFRYATAGFSHVVFVDIDRDAVQELVSRKRNLKNNMQITTMIADITKVTAEEILLNIDPVDVVVCNLAIHYLIGTEKNIKHIFDLASKLLKKGGRFIYTAFDGQTVFDLLRDGDWNIYEGEVLKFSIRKLYNNAEFGVGQKIEVLLPFSNNEYYTEYLVNNDYMREIANQTGFDFDKKSFLSYGKKKMMLSRDEEKYIGLHYAVTCIKK